ncbi:MAG: hypothetical protein E3J72_11530 [Planctomycetota bacterium]|nr:MAG: hypothetical protein E3J72_11530 [Planctomycetota bacterium]
MAVQCPRCGSQYDITLFGFGRKVKCRCGKMLDAREAHTSRPKPPPHLRIVEPEPGEREDEKP